MFDSKAVAKQERIRYLKEAMDRFYSPLLFHFENMQAWGNYLGNIGGYAYSKPELDRKLQDMYQIMRNGARYGSDEAQAAWHSFQPIAVSASSPGAFQARASYLYEILRREFLQLQTQYRRELGFE